MRQFTHNLPSDYAIIAPRAPYQARADKGGYSWRKVKPDTWGSPTLSELHLSADNLVSLVDNWLASVKIASASFDVIGFSQGGALALTLAALYPKRVNKIAVLSGFVPRGVDEILRPKLLNHIRFFWAHGTEDEIISFERGLDSINLVKNSGADVILCQAKTGHKVSKNCRHALSDFFNKD